MLSHQGVALSEKDQNSREVRCLVKRRCDLTGGSVSLGMDFEVSEAHARHGLSLPAGWDVALGHLSSTRPAMPAAMMIMD